MLCRTFFLAGLVLASETLPAAVLSIGHRGDSLYAPENTVSAFVSALGKADLVELDARVSSDGQLIVMHDTTVDRTTDGSGAVSSLTVAQLKLLDAGFWFSSAFIGERVPTLEESITNILPQAIPLIEQKAGTAAQYVTELRRLGAVSNVVLQSFDWAFLTSVHALEPGIRLGALGSGAFTSATLTNIINTGAEMVAWEKASVTPAMLSLVRGAGLQLFVWTVDGAQIKTFIDMGVDGIISNDPGLVKDFQQPTTNGPVNLGQGLIAYWKMDDGLVHLWNVQVADSRGSNTATLVRADGQSHWLTSGLPMFGGCVQLDGTNASITVPQTGALDINTNGVSFSAWVRLPRLPSQLATSYGAIYDSTTDCYVLYLDRSNRELRFKITDATGHAARPGIPEARLQTNQWLHIVGTYSGQASPAAGEAAIYLNGQLVDAHVGNDSTTPLGLTGNVKPGQIAALGREGPTGGNYFTGLADDVAIWNRALTAAEVTNIYQGGLIGQSLADLTRQPTTLIQLTRVHLVPVGNQLEIDFQNQGTWQSFRLLRRSEWSAPFLAVPGLTPVALGGGAYRFSYSLTTNAMEWFRVEGQ